MTELESNEYSTTPIIHIGTSGSENPTDTPYTAYVKYNSHSHKPVSPVSFLYSNVKVGDRVSLIDINGEDAFYRETPESSVSVIAVTKDAITLSSLAKSSVYNGTLMVTRGVNTFKVNNVKIDEDSATIVRGFNRNGFVSSELLTQALTKLSHVSYTLPSQNLNSSDPQSPKGSFYVDVNEFNDQLLVSGTGVLSEQALPDLYLVKGSKYRFTFSSELRGIGGLYVTSSRTFSVGENPPAQQYTNGISFDSVNYQKISLDFDVPYASPNHLYYMNYTDSNLVGNLYLINKDYRNLPFYYSGLAALIQVPELSPLPDYSLPLILSSSYGRLLSVKVLPIWDYAYRAGYLRINIVVLKPDSTKTYLLQNDLVVDQFGLTEIEIGADLGIIEPQDVAQLNIYNPLNLHSIQCFTEYALI